MEILLVQLGCVYIQYSKDFVAHPATPHWGIHVKIHDCEILNWLNGLVHNKFKPRNENFIRQCMDLCRLKNHTNSYTVTLIPVFHVQLNLLSVLQTGFGFVIVIAMLFFFMQIFHVAGQQLYLKTRQGMHCWHLQLRIAVMERKLQKKWKSRI